MQRTVLLSYRYVTYRYVSAPCTYVYTIQKVQPSFLNLIEKHEQLAQLAQHDTVKVHNTVRV